MRAVRAITKHALVLWLAATLATTSSTGCSASWPRVTSVSDARFGSSAPSSIDLLPVDLEVWVQPGLQEDAEQTRLAAENRVIGAAAEVLYRHGHQVGAILGWQGSYVGAGGQEVTVMEPATLLATVDSLASYGTAMALTPSEMPVPYLPARLGERTGSEATLYIGGWGFVGRKRDSTGEAVLKAVVVGIVLIGVVAIVAAISKKSDSLGKVFDGVGQGAGRVVKMAASAGRVALRAAAQAGTAVVDLGRVGVDVTMDVVQQLPDDAFGRSETHRNLVSGRPEWSQAKDARVSGASALYLEMTLVDNATGLVRWHAHQQFPANPKNGKQVARAVASMLAAMPRAAAPTAPGTAPTPPQGAPDFSPPGFSPPAFTAPAPAVEAPATSPGLAAAAPGS